MLIRFVPVEKHIHVHLNTCIFCFSNFDRDYELQVLIGNDIINLSNSIEHNLLPFWHQVYPVPVVRKYCCKNIASALLAIAYSPRHWDTHPSFLLVAGQYKLNITPVFCCYLMTCYLFHISTSV